MMSQLSPFLYRKSMFVKQSSLSSSWRPRSQPPSHRPPQWILAVMAYASKSPVPSPWSLRYWSGGDSGCTISLSPPPVQWNAVHWLVNIARPSLSLWHTVFNQTERVRELNSHMPRKKNNRKCSKCSASPDYQVMVQSPVETYACNELTLSKCAVPNWTELNATAEWKRGIRHTPYGPAAFLGAETPQLSINLSCFDGVLTFSRGNWRAVLGCGFGWVWSGRTWGIDDCKAFINRRSQILHRT